MHGYMYAILQINEYDEINCEGPWSDCADLGSPGFEAICGGSTYTYVREQNLKGILYSSRGKVGSLDTRGSEARPGPGVLI
jgi:hypothetical protein